MSCCSLAVAAILYTWYMFMFELLDELQTNLTTNNHKFTIIKSLKHFFWFDVWMISFLLLVLNLERTSLKGLSYLSFAQVLLTAFNNYI